MKKVILIFTTLTFHHFSLAQATFEKYYNAAGTATLVLNELSSGNLFTGISYQSGISTMDSEGNGYHEVPVHLGC